MPIRLSYLADLGPGGKLDWGRDTGGNIPASGYILPNIQDTAVYLKICEHAQKGNFEGTMVDWDAHALKVNGPDLISILTEVYGGPENVPPESIVGRHFAFAKRLGESKYLAFVAVAI